MAINGNNILILVDGSVVAGTKSNEAQVECDAIEVASPPMAFGHPIFQAEEIGR